MDDDRIAKACRTPERDAEIAEVIEDGFSDAPCPRPSEEQILRFTQAWEAARDTCTDASPAQQKYDLLIEPIRQKAREMGYAIGVHGSLNRDIDLIAVPWVENAVRPRELAMALLALCEEINGIAHLSWYPARGQEFTLDGGPGHKPHGRVGWVINLTMGEGPYIDLSVIPPNPAPAHYTPP